MMKNDVSHWKSLRRIVTAAALIFGISGNAAVFWDSAEADRDSRHAVFFDVGVEIHQGVRLEKDTRLGQAEYYLSIVTGDKPRKRMPISRKIFDERYQSLRNLVISSQSRYPADECRARYRVIKSSEKNPAWDTSICPATLSDERRAKINEWYAKTLRIVQNSRF